MLPFLLLIPLMCSVGFFVLSKHVCWREFLITVAAVLAVMGIGVGICYIGASSDTELLNGFVKDKKKVRVSCEHSYDCFCYDSCTTDSNGYETCFQICQTCYEHSHDYDWDVKTSIGTISIQRIDSQGSKEPPRWTKVQIGEPASLPHTFENYIKMAPGSILNIEGSKELFEGLLPKYPRVVDYYRVQRVLPVKVAIPNLRELNHALSMQAGILGPEKQANVIMVLVKTGNQAYTHALTEHWMGGKKNDIIIVVGVPDGSKQIAWASVISWSNVELLKIKIRDEILGLRTIDQLAPWVDNNLTPLVRKHFTRKPMAEFEYLRYQYTPSPTVMFFLLFLSLLVSVGLSVYFVKEDPFGSGLRYRRRF